jgi:hypothetical protein
MSHISSQGNNAIIYLTYVFLLATGLFIAIKFNRKDSFLSSNGTQRGLPLAQNFIASGMYSKIPDKQRVSGVFVQKRLG